eukprot:6190768-Pleurochrysis_carterae.AAC.2
MHASYEACSASSSPGAAGPCTWRGKPDAAWPQRDRHPRPRPFEAVKHDDGDRYRLISLHSTFTI